MRKRSPADIHSDDGPAASSDIDVKSHILDDAGDGGSRLTPSKKKPRMSPQKRGVKGEPDENGKPRQQVRKWTAEEDAIFLDVMEKMCLAGFWQEIKADGRLVYRGPAGIRAHFLAFFKNARTSADGEQP